MSRITLEEPGFQDFAETIASGNRAQRRAFARLAKKGVPIIAGGAENPSHPLAPPTVSGSDFTVDLALQQPTRITRMLMDLTLQKFISDRVFSSSGGVTGGAVVYDEAVANELYLDRDVQQVAAGSEFPIVDASRAVPKVAEVEKWGAKIFITDEAKDRNDQSGFANKIRQMANTQVRKINQRAMEVLSASIAASSQTFTGVDWSSVVTSGSSQTSAEDWPLRDFAEANRLAEVDELGVVYDLVLLNPQEYTQMVIVYGAAGVNEVLSSLNFDVYVSNRVTAGTAIFVAEKQVGEMRVEKPLGTVSWYEEGTERTWVQSSVRPVQFVTNPFAVLQATGLAG